MAPKFEISYDPVGDTLYLRACQPYDEQDSVLEEDGSIIRRHPQTNEVEAVELMSFSRWLPEELHKLPIPAELVAILQACSAYAKAA